MFACDRLPAAATEMEKKVSLSFLYAYTALLYGMTTMTMEQKQEAHREQKNKKNDR